MKSVLVQFLALFSLVCGLAIAGQGQCDPMKDPNQCLYSQLPGMPPPPPATDMTPLSADTAIQTAYNIAKGAQSNPTGEVMDVAIAAISVGYPPAGMVLGILKGLFDTGGPDQVGQAIQAINQRIDKLQTDLNQLQGTVQQIQDRQFNDENLARTHTLLDRKNDIQYDASKMSTKPDDKDLVPLLVHIQQTADWFVDDPDLWQWSDLRVRTDSSGVQVSGMNPDFKTYPAFEAYAHALVLWMSALQYASKGNVAFITQDKNRVHALLRHAAFLSVRPDFQDGTGCSSRYPGGCPKTLAEQVLARNSCSLDQVHGPDKKNMCTGHVVCSDQQRHRIYTSPKYPSLISFSSQNDPGEACGYDRRDPPLETARAELLNQYGFDFMLDLARKLQRLAKTGTTEEDFFKYRFDMTFWTGQFLYTVKPNGELLMYRHDTGVDKNPPQNTQLTCSSNIRAVCAAMASSTLKLTAASSPQALSSRVSPARLGAATPAAPQYPVIHKWLGPYVVGSGWQQFRQVMPAGSGNAIVQTPKGNVQSGGIVFYAVANDGSLLWYRINSIPDDKAPGGYTYQWKGPIKVASGFNAYKQVFSGGDGVVYAIGTDGSLNQYQFTDFQDVNTLSRTPVIRGGSNRVAVGAAKPPYDGPNRIATGWGNYTQVFSAGQGIIYAITPDGRLLWFKDLGFGGQKSLWRFAAPKQVGNGWGNMKRVFSPGDGVIYGISNSGDVYWYKHDGYQDGTQKWEGPTKIASDWGTFVQVFPWMPTATPAGSGIH